MISKYHNQKMQTNPRHREEEPHNIYNVVFFVMHYIVSILNFAIILKRKRKLVVLLLLSHRCIVTFNVLWLFLAVPWVGLQYVIVVFPYHTHLLFETIIK